MRNKVVYHQSSSSSSSSPSSNRIAISSRYVAYAQRAANGPTSLTEEHRVVKIAQFRFANKRQSKVRAEIRTLFCATWLTISSCVMQCSVELKLTNEKQNVGDSARRSDDDGGLSSFASLYVSYFKRTWACLFACYTGYEEKGDCFQLIFQSPFKCISTRFVQNCQCDTVRGKRGSSLPSGSCFVWVGELSSLSSIAIWNASKRRTPLILSCHTG